MAHPLAKVFTWFKSLRHIPLFILACFSLAHFLRLWLGDHPNFELHASTLGNYLSCVLSFGGMHKGHFYLNLVGLDSEEE